MAERAASRRWAATPFAALEEVEPSIPWGRSAAFLTTEPNRIVDKVHEEAMPVILTTKEEVETWLTYPWEEAKALQRPLPDAKLQMVPLPLLSAEL